MLAVAADGINQGWGRRSVEGLAHFSVGGRELAIEKILGRARLSAGRQEAWQHGGHRPEGEHPQEHSTGNLQHIAHVYRFFLMGL